MLTGSQTAILGLFISMSVWGVFTDFFFANVYSQIVLPRIKVGLGNLQDFLALEFYDSVSAYF